jgi:hypothetical protein
MNKIERVMELHNNGYDLNEVSEILDIEPTIVEEIINENLYTVNESNIKRFYELIDLSEELSLLLEPIVDKAIYIKNNNIYIGDDKVEFRFSKQGNLYFTLKGVYIKEPIRSKVMSKVQELLTETKELTELPKYIVKKFVSKTGNKYIGWISKRTEKLVMLSQYEKGIEKLNEQLKAIEYNVLREETNYVHSIEREPTEPEKDEIYGSKEPEVFIERTAELKELLQVVLEMKTRKISSEEFELLREIQSEIGNIIGE